MPNPGSTGTFNIADRPSAKANPPKAAEPRTAIRTFFMLIPFDLVRVY
jgi:hypothetical protein